MKLISPLSQEYAINQSVSVKHEAYGFWIALTLLHPEEAHIPTYEPTESCSPGFLGPPRQFHRCPHTSQGRGAAE